ncbi:hypothetical protein EYF80_009740 [Liparis tanakae]|uniref:Uncharacterized protein n=1 Tax=Liparis tanakae TaxID=230148 RepID=A0A4Z2IR41_9TELE|nr:hypothetical protein EYF80_009740 [Liparis tanakae]
MFLCSAPVPRLAVPPSPGSPSPVPPSPGSPSPVPPSPGSPSPGPPASRELLLAAAAAAAAALSVSGGSSGSTGSMPLQRFSRHPTSLHRVQSSHTVIPLVVVVVSCIRSHSCSGAD